MRRLETWLFGLFDRIDPEERRRYALRILVASVILWPITSMTVFRTEPQGVLALSWFAIIFTMVDIILTTDVRKAEDENDS